MSSTAISWRSLGDVLYRSVPIYKSFSFGDDIIDLGNFLGAAAPFGGPVAFIPNPNALTQLKAYGAQAHGTLSIFSASGTALAQVQLQTHGCRVLGLAWTASEFLAVIHEDGNVDIYDPMGTLSPKSFSLSSDAHDTDSLAMRSHVVSYAVCGTGMAAALRKPDGDCDVVAVFDFDEPIPIVMHSASRTLNGGFPTSITVIDGANTADGRMEILLGTPERTVLVIDSEDICSDQQLESVLGSVPLNIAVSPAGRYLALFGEDGVITVMDASFEQKLLEFATKAESRPLQLVWCGEVCFYF
jgi:vacuolar protein sorting-associated protein 16